MLVSSVLCYASNFRFSFQDARLQHLSIVFLIAGQLDLVYFAERLVFAYVVSLSFESMFCARKFDDFFLRWHLGIFSIAAGF